MAGGAERPVCAVDAGICGNHAMGYRGIDDHVRPYLPLAQSGDLFERHVTGQMQNEKESV
jgi:hypothetical protein